MVKQIHVISGPFYSQLLIQHSKDTPFLTKYMTKECVINFENKSEYDDRQLWSRLLSPKESKQEMKMQLFQSVEIDDGDTTLDHEQRELFIYRQFILSEEQMLDNQYPRIDRYPEYFRFSPNSQFHLLPLSTQILSIDCEMV